MVHHTNAAFSYQPLCFRPCYSTEFSNGTAGTDGRNRCASGGAWQDLATSTHKKCTDIDDDSAAGLNDIECLTIRLKVVSRCVCALVRSPDFDGVVISDGSKGKEKV